MSEGTFAYRELQRADRETRDAALTDLTLRPLKYVVRIESKWVYIEKNGDGWIARRSEFYVCTNEHAQVEWTYKRYTRWQTPEGAARMAHRAPRLGGWLDRWNGESP